MKKFEPGKVISTDFGAPIKIVKYLASGGQGDVYIVEYAGKKKALKWYNPLALKEPDAFYDNLKHNADKGSPDKAFLWPDAVTEKIEGSFGYIMDLRPDGYYELSKILASEKYRFVSFKAAIDACIVITNAFRKLHTAGYCYGDMNDGHFFINPQTGDVIICDNDDVVPNGTKVSVLQHPRYSAPEMVISEGKRSPDKQSERYVLSVLIFLILCGGHPLEGKQWLVPCMDFVKSKDLYGVNPVFIFDPNNDSNRPVENIHVNTIHRWNMMPLFFKEMCIKAFSKQSLLEPYKRPCELDWLKVLVRLRNCVVRCSCGSEMFVDGIGSYKCDCCEETIEIKNALELPTYSIIALKGTRIYRCQVGICNIEEALDPVLHVVAKGDGTLGVKNMTSDPIKAFTPSRKEKVIEPGMVVPFISGISIVVYDKTINLT